MIYRIRQTQLLKGVFGKREIYPGNWIVEMDMEEDSYLVDSYQQETFKWTLIAQGPTFLEAKKGLILWLQGEVSVEETPQSEYAD